MPAAVPSGSFRNRVWGALFVGALSAVGELAHREVFHNIPHGPPWLLPAQGLLWGAVLGPLSALLGSWWRLPFALAAVFGVGKGVPIATSGIIVYVPGMSEEESLRILILAHILLGGWLGISVRLLVTLPRAFGRKPLGFVGPPVYPCCDDCGMSPVHPLLLRPDYNAFRAKPQQFCCSRCRRKRMRARWRDEWLILTGFSLF